MRWARERGIDLRAFILELNGDRRPGAALYELTRSDYFGLTQIYTNLDLASYYATRGKLNDVDVFECGRGEYTALQIACSKGYYDIVKAILAAGANKDKTSKSGSWTPLQCAALGGA